MYFIGKSHPITLSVTVRAIFEYARADARMYMNSSWGLQAPPPRVTSEQVRCGGRIAALEQYSEREFAHGGHLEVYEYSFIGKI